MDCNYNQINLFLVPDDNDVNGYVIRRGMKNAFRKQVVDSNVFAFDDMITIDIYKSVNTQSRIEMYLALLTTDDCNNYEFKSRMDCTDGCFYEECHFEFPQISQSSLLCKYKCRAASQVLVRRTVKPGTMYLPSYIKIVGLTAMTLTD